jgi:multimeric flavodoxin WrbA
MNNKHKILFISGSPRNGNTDFLFSKLYEAIDNENKQLILLKDKDIKFCRGCLFCHAKPSCAIKDDMEGILAEMTKADILIIGTPNYFDNVSGLMKSFMDRCHPLYKEKLLSGKKVILIFVGGGEIKGTKKYLNISFLGFVRYLKLKLIGSYAFQALDINELKEKNVFREFDKIIRKIN